MGHSLRDKGRIGFIGLGMTGRTCNVMMAGAPRSGALEMAVGPTSSGNFNGSRLTI